VTLHRRWIAREWLYLVGGLVEAFLAFFLFGPIFTPPAGRVIVVVVIAARYTIPTMREVEGQDSSEMRLRKASTFCAY
jgi:hypothetical protein